MEICIAAIDCAAGLQPLAGTRSGYLSKKKTLCRVLGKGPEGREIETVGIKNGVSSCTTLFTLHPIPDRKLRPIILAPSLESKSHINNGK